MLEMTALEAFSGLSGVEFASISLGPPSTSPKHSSHSSSPFTSAWSTSVFDTFSFYEGILLTGMLIIWRQPSLYRGHREESYGTIRPHSTGSSSLLRCTFVYSPTVIQTFCSQIGCCWWLPGDKRHSVRAIDTGDNGEEWNSWQKRGSTSTLISTFHSSASVAPLVKVVSTLGWFAYPRMGWLGIQQWQERRKPQSVVPLTIRAVRTLKVITANMQVT